MSRLSFPVAVIVAVVLLTTACGDSSDGSDAALDQETAPATTSSTSTTSAVTTESTMTAETETGTENGEAENPGEPEEPDEPEPAADLVIDGAFVDGEIIIEDRRFEVERGSSVLITFESDQVEHIHLHGYDILVDLVPGEPAELAFVADSPGSFEVELEDSRRFLFELLVR